jgi:hypothetical protein
MVNFIFPFFIFTDNAFRESEAVAAAAVVLAAEVAIISETIAPTKLTRQWPRRTRG